jgi:hypothetical protein
LGATHSAELAYVFDSSGHDVLYNTTFTPAEQLLSLEIIRYW